ncbi:MAG: hypothetical protein WKF66_02090 [Pedobacter sp.]
MPLMLDHLWYDWISSNILPILTKELMNPCDYTGMAAWTISKDIGNPKINSDVSSITDEIAY